MNRQARLKARELLKTRPIENHETAAWANFFESKPVSNVAIPSEMGVIDAKEYVEMNQK